MSDENETENEIKVGDKVRLLSGLYDPHEMGDIGTVVRVFEDDSVDVYVEGKDDPTCKWLYLRREFALLSAKEIAALEGRTNDLPFEVYVGSIRVAAFATLELRGAVIGTIRDNLKVTTKEAGL